MPGSSRSFLTERAPDLDPLANARERSRIWLHLRSYALFISLHWTRCYGVNTIASMKISARNQLRGKVEAVVLGVVTAKVAVRVGENLIESVITRQSVEDLGIKVGDEVTAVIKSTEIMLMVD